MKIDEAIEKINDHLEEFGIPVNETERSVMRATLEELYLTGMEQGRQSLQDELRHLLGVVK